MDYQYNRITNKLLKYSVTTTQFTNTVFSDKAKNETKTSKL